MRLTQLRALVALSDNGSIRSAANSLGLSQSALTRSLRELERDTGAALLDRRQHGTEFTEAGRSLLQHARLVQATLRRAEEDVRRISGQSVPRARIAVTPFLASLGISRLYNQFRRRYPDGLLELDIGILSSSLPRLIDGSLDVSFCIVEPTELPNELTFQQFRTVNMVAVTRKKDLAKPQSWEALTHEQWVLNPSPATTDAYFHSWMSRKGVKLRNKTILCRSAQMLSSLVEELDVIAVCPEPLYYARLAPAGIYRVGLPELPEPLPMGALTMTHMPKSQAVQDLISIAEHISLKI